MIEPSQPGIRIGWRLGLASRPPLSGWGHDFSHIPDESGYCCDDGKAWPVGACLPLRSSSPLFWSSCLDQLEGLEIGKFVPPKGWLVEVAGTMPALGTRS